MNNDNELEQKFLELVENYKRVIYKVCFMYANDDETIGDLYQEVVLNLWTAFPRFRNESKPSTWVYRVSMNTCITNLRHKRTQPDTIVLTSSMADLFPDESDKEQLHELYRLISQLGELERALILLWLDDKSYDEIAEILNISVSNVGVRINRIKTKLKTMSND
ncbi:MAG: sigma-70 family RNA polymerase sigma factor [Bacteroidales bacterium]|jgi:RNA polymerase sigma-70 factor (ECF subfamily)|nr:sigma-70 family RNA polymerase sigma factor [Bacteroidales bacterium]